MPLVLTRRVSERIVLVSDNTEVFIKFADIRNNAPYLTVDEIRPMTSTADGNLTRPDGLPVHHSEVEPAKVDYQVRSTGVMVRFPSGTARIEVGGLLGKQAKLLVSAPRSVGAHREEIWEKLRGTGETHL